MLDAWSTHHLTGAGKRKREMAAEHGVGIDNRFVRHIDSAEEQLKEDLRLGSSTHHPVHLLSAQAKIESINHESTPIGVTDSVRGLSTPDGHVYILKHGGDPKKIDEIMNIYFKNSGVDVTTATGVCFSTQPNLVHEVVVHWGRLNAYAGNLQDVISHPSISGGADTFALIEAGIIEPYDYSQIVYTCYKQGMRRTDFTATTLGGSFIRSDEFTQQLANDPVNWMLRGIQLGIIKN